MDPYPPLPEGTVTLLFTDIEGSTRLLQQLGDDYASVLTEHRHLLRETFRAHQGSELGTEGDSFFVVFAQATDAAAAAIAGQQVLLTYPWPEGAAVRVRMGLHTGEPTCTAGEYVGLDVHRVARIRDAAHGGQILLSQRTRDLLASDLPPDVSVRDLGAHRLKDLQAPEHLFQLVLADQPEEFPPPRSLEAVAHNLPIQLTRFIGRDAERAAVQELLGRTRLLTLTGVGGCGKTRLALQVAADLVEAYGDGVWLVELAALTDPALVPQEVASALGVREEPGRPLGATLTDHLRSKQLLLVLDNCEHLVGACAALADRLLRASPGLQILATSREVLGVRGEQAYRVPSLGLPAPQARPGVEELPQYDAVRLFVERALESQPAFALTAGNGAAVVEVCRRLDGIPLALELAAARLRVLPVEQISARLDDRFRLLTGGSRTAVPRQQTLRAAIDWSHELLTEGERVLLRRLSVFAGGFTLEAAEAVCAGAGVDGDESEVLDLLEQLVSKSLVLAEPGEEARYRLLETIRAYGTEQLRGSDEESELRARHRDWYLSVAEASEPELTGQEQGKWLERLEREHDNLRAALVWAQASGGEAVLRLTGALWRFWEMRGHFAEGRGWLDAVLARNEGSASARAKALTGAGTLVWHQGEYERASTLHKEALALYRELGDKWGIAFSLNNLAVQTSARGEYERTGPLLEESLALFREIGDRRGIIFASNNLGLLAAWQREYERAVAHYEESLALSREIGDKWLMAVLLGNLGEMRKDQGDYGRAVRLLEESLALSRELGSKQYAASSLVYLGLIALKEGDCRAARALLEESLALRQELGNRRGIIESLEALAGESSAAGDAERGARLLGAAAALREGIGAPLPPSEHADFDRNVALARATLGEALFSAAWGEGRAMTLEQAIAYGLRETADA